MVYITYAMELLTKMNLIIESIVKSGGNWAYVIMFLILFTGAACVFTAPILPSVSLIFLVTSLSIGGTLNPVLSFITLVAAIALGDLVGYYIGRLIGEKLISTNRLPIIKDKHINKTRVLYNKVDYLTIIFARFTPIVGSLAQMVAGAINFNLASFFKRNVVAGVIWLSVHFAAGLIISEIPSFKNNYVVLFMVVPIFSLIVSATYYIKKNYKLILSLRQI